MSQRDLLLTVLRRGQTMVHRHIDDFTDAEMFVRPVPGANHVAWQLTHVAFILEKTLKALGLSGEVKPLPAEFTHHETDLSKVDDPLEFPGKAVLMNFFTGSYAAIIAAVEKMSEDDLTRPFPGSTSAVPPTIAFTLLMQPLHMTMHLGQIQVIRRALKKPVLF